MRCVLGRNRPTVENLCRTYCASLSEEGFLHVIQKLRKDDFEGEEGKKQQDEIHRIFHTHKPLAGTPTQTLEYQVSCQGRTVKCHNPWPSLRLFFSVGGSVFFGP